MRHYYIIALFSLCSFACTNKEAKISYTFSESSPIDSLLNTYVLDENIDFIGNSIADFCALTDSTFLLSSQKNVYVYSHNGKQLEILGNQNGSLSYLLPDKICVTDQCIYIWCKKQRKLFTYSKANNNLLSVYDLFDYPMKEFSVYEDRYLCSLHNGTIDNKVFDIYDLRHKKSVRSFSIDNQEDILLFIAQPSGGLTISRDSVYWMTPSDLVLNSLSIEKMNDVPKVFHFDDSDFEVEKLSTDAANIINYKRQEMIGYIESNSRVIQIEAFDNKIYILAEIGIIERNGNELDFSRRKIKLYVFSDKSTPLHAYHLNYPQNCVSAQLINGTLCTLRAEHTNDEYDYRIVFEQYFIP